jgi:hypothetical protein
MTSIEELCPGVGDGEKIYASGAMFSRALLAVKSGTAAFKPPKVDPS